MISCKRWFDLQPNELINLKTKFDIQLHFGYNETINSSVFYSNLIAVTAQISV